MSFIGKNIKKIRLARKMSQTVFAEIFGLKRTTLGAYEEERSEPGFDLVIRFAEYFRLSIDSLISKELTVNEIFHFRAELMYETKQTFFRFLQIEKLKSGVNSVAELIKNSQKVGFPLNFDSNIIAVEVDKGNDFPEHLHNAKILFCTEKNQIEDGAEDFFLCIGENRAFVTRLRVENGKFRVINSLSDENDINSLEIFKIIGMLK